ncbi:hypothetical protein LOK49_LG06G00694 [Camellia lanceoleosa]|uniref:Uncharacterized protein n=1 Tax=Camellia lanceoleosa TaxID=1840588 RepID=A0ACC0HHJ0_9ERIC|nr:hypothetical protein LOK49_LG06G00694 [Camellia lanceoleosa]
MGWREHAIVAASPPTEDAVIATEPLMKEDLVSYLASGCKPKEKWRIGTEHEKFGSEFGTLQPMKYGQIAELLNGMAIFDTMRHIRPDVSTVLKEAFKVFCNKQVSGCSSAELLDL